MNTDKVKSVRNLCSSVFSFPRSSRKSKSAIALVPGCAPACKDGNQEVKTTHTKKWFVLLEGKSRRILLDNRKDQVMLLEAHLNTIAAEKFGPVENYYK